MEIKNLSGTSLSDIVGCLTASFEGYFVQLPDDIGYWEKRYANARVDYNLSFGAFDNGKLVAFIINCIDTVNSIKTAYNTGTGVLPAYRGQKLVDQLYNHAFPVLKAERVEQLCLEVIQKNERAIAVYKRLGFEISHDLPCFTGRISLPVKEDIEITEIKYKLALPYIEEATNYYSWDFNLQAIKTAQKQWRYFTVSEKGKYLGYFVLNPTGNTIVQLELNKGLGNGNWKTLVYAISTISPEIRVLNVNANRTTLIATLLQAGLENNIDQYQMERAI